MSGNIWSRADADVSASPWVKVTPAVVDNPGTTADTVVQLPALNAQFAAFTITADGEVRIVDGPPNLKE